MSFTLRSPSFAHEHPIPDRHTCVGSGEAPALDWTDAPKGTQSFALVVDDPDAPDPQAPQRIFVHWLAFNIPGGENRLLEGGRLPLGAAHGKNDYGVLGFSGPCPPKGRHRYYFRLHALDTRLPQREFPPNRAQLEELMAGHVLASATLMGTYEKPRR